MPPYYRDTNPKIEALQVRLLRTASPWHKMEMLARLNVSARALTMAGLRQRFPKAGEAELRRRLANLLLGADLARKMYGEADDTA